MTCRMPERDSPAYSLGRCPDLNQLFQAGAKWPRDMLCCPFGRVQRGGRIINCLESEVWAAIRILGGPNGEIRKGCTEERQERDAPTKARHASLRSTRKSRPGEEPEAGHCNRPFRSPQKGSKSPAKALKQIVTRRTGLRPDYTSLFARSAVRVREVRPL